MAGVMKIRVLIADDHHLVRAGIAALLANQPDIEVVGEAADGLQAIEKVKLLKPDIVLMDINMPLMNGIEAAHRIVHGEPPVKVLILTQYEHEEYVRRVIQSGASGYILKNSLTGDLMLAIHAVQMNEKFFTPSISSLIVQTFVKQTLGEAPQKTTRELTHREMEILQLIAEGNTNQQIAEKLFISVRTVEFHRANILDKVGVHDVAGLVKYAIQKKIIRIDE